VAGAQGLELTTQICPSAVLPPAIPLTDQLTAVFARPVA
jgi:hypothetical protein